METRRSAYLEALKISKRLKRKKIKGSNLKKKWTSKGATKKFFISEIERLTDLDEQKDIIEIKEKLPIQKELTRPSFMLESPSARKGDIKTIKLLRRLRRGRLRRVGLVKPPKKPFIKHRRKSDSELLHNRSKIFKSILINLIREDEE